MKTAAGIMSTAKKTARVGNCSRMDTLLSRLAEVGEKAGLLNDLKQHAEQLEKKIRQLEKEAEKYKVSALCCGPIITAVHPGSLCPRALKLTARRRNEPRGGGAASPGGVPAGPSGVPRTYWLSMADLLAILFSERAFNSTTL